MDEFFSPTTTNARKAEIEKVLANFSGQAAAWKDCLFFLTNTNNHYVCMFSLTTLETFIHRRWVGLSLELGNALKELGDGGRDVGELDDVALRSLCKLSKSCKLVRNPLFRCQPF